MKFNMNNTIKVKPTDRGIQLMVDIKNNNLPKRLHTTFEKQKSNLEKGGMLQMQMHEFLNIFGGLGLLLTKYVELNIIINSNEL